jgi:SH3-like domain-containing protein
VQVKVWGTLYPQGRLSPVPEIVASSIQSASPAPGNGGEEEAIVIVRAGVINVRTAPDVNAPPVGQLEGGQRCPIIQGSADGQWWRVCCTADGETVWIIDQLVDTDGPVDAVPVVDAGDVPAPVFSPGKVKAEVNIPLLNARSSPNATADLIAIVEGGETFDVLAANDARDWYQVCCVEGQEAWLAAEYVTIQGPAGSVPIFGQEPTQPQEAAAAADPASFSFDLTEQEQFAETTGVRIYLFATDDGARALEGYSALVTKDGQKKTAPRRRRPGGPRKAAGFPAPDPVGGFR